MEHVWYVEGRGNLMIEYTPEGAKGEWEGGYFSFVCTTYLVFVLSGTVAFVGSHLDVVPANPETWERNPFKLVVEVGTPIAVKMVCLEMCLECTPLVEKASYSL